MTQKKLVAVSFLRSSNMNQEKVFGFKKRIVMVDFVSKIANTLQNVST